MPASESFSVINGPSYDYRVYALISTESTVFFTAELVNSNFSNPGNTRLSNYNRFSS